MHAAGDPLEQFLVGLERDGKNPLIIAAEATDQPVARDQNAQGSRVNVGSGDMFGAPNLPGDIACLFVPGGDAIHPGQFSIEEDEALGEVVVEIFPLVVVTGEIAQANAGLGPVDLGSDLRRVMGRNLEDDLIGSGGDLVVDDDPVRGGVA